MAALTGIGSAIYLSIYSSVYLYAYIADLRDSVSDKVGDPRDGHRVGHLYICLSIYLSIYLYAYIADLGDPVSDKVGDPCDGRLDWDRVGRDGALVGPPVVDGYAQQNLARVPVEAGEEPRSPLSLSSLCHPTVWGRPAAGEQ